MPKPKNEGYLGNSQVKRAGITEEWDDEKVQEYLRCTRDPAYFISKYIKIISLDEGLVNFNLYEYQKNLIDQFIDNRFNIVLACRQSGKSITVCAYLLWYLLFHPEQTVAILANKGATAREMLSRITTMLENVPFFLQPGTKALNKGSIDFENNSRIIASATTTSSIRGLSVNLLYLDEFAFVENAEQFYTGTYPVITSGRNSKVIITSTANGVGNMFHRIWESSVTGSNEFANYQVNWWDVPRDEKWKDQTVANTSELQFEQEFGNSFLGTGRTLIPSNIILGLTSENPMELYGNVRVYKKPKPHHEYIMTVDVAQGKGMDYSTFTIFDIHDGNMFEQVCTMRDNMISPMLLPDICAKYGKLYNDCLIIVENNDQGTMVCRELYYELEYENMFLTSAVKADGVGVRMTKKVKALGCANLKRNNGREKTLCKRYRYDTRVCNFCIKRTIIPSRWWMS